MILQSSEIREKYKLKLYKTKYLIFDVSWLFYNVYILLFEYFPKLLSKSMNDAETG